MGASLVAQLVKNLPAMWETWVLSLCWEDPLEKGKPTHSSIPAWRIPRTVESMLLLLLSHFSCVHRVTKSQTQLTDFYLLTQRLKCWYEKEHYIKLRS